MRTMLVAVFAAMALGVSACAGTSPATAAREAPACGATHGFVMTTDSARTLASEAHVGERVVISVGDRIVARLTVRDPVEGPLLVTGSTADDVAQMRGKLCSG